MSESGQRKTKVAILGGGVGALSAAFELTSASGWQDQFEVTVYQMGWRLGGKGASGRNAVMGQRIEEHGLHFWLGFYENAFRMMRHCYQENQRPLTTPLATWSEAFKPCNEVTVEDHVDGEWIPWLLTFVPNGDTPGDTIELPSIWEMIGTTLEFLRNLLVKSSLPGATGDGEQPFLEKLTALVGDMKLEGESLARSAGERILHAAGSHVRNAAASGEQHQPAAHLLLGNLVETYWQWIVHQFGGGRPSEEWRRFWIMTEFGVTNIRGILADNVLLDGLSAIEEYDYQEWLTRHGASPTVSTCGLVRAFYDLCFSPQATVAAGTFLKGMLRILFTYRGAVYWRMQAGMGDTIFAPLYQVLERRGVQFHFFHKVNGLHLSPDQRVVESISIGRQATVKSGKYAPLATVRRLPCWPSEPHFEQLVEGEELKQRAINLESYWADWTDVEQLTLLQGRDFDHVIFGISLGSVPILCGELMEARPEWRAMVQQVQTTPTQAFQMWFLPDIAGLGWPNWQNESPLLTSFIEPMDTFANLDQLLIREQWPGDQSPAAIGYFCGPLADPGLPPPADHQFPAQQLEAVYHTALESLTGIAGDLLPATQRGDGSFDFDLLADAAHGDGEARFRAQYFRANVDPSERYVMSVKGSTQYRLRAAGSGFENLWLAGDWTDNGVNAGCVEAAVISGMQAAAGLAGKPSTATGEGFGERGRV